MIHDERTRQGSAAQLSVRTDQRRALYPSWHLQCLELGPHVETRRTELSSLANFVVDEEEVTVLF